jgi:glutamine synthetase
MSIALEYIWIDGTKPTKELRSKTKVLKKMPENGPPDWGFDGSSTGQAKGSFSDVILKPVRSYEDPTRKGKWKATYLVICETYNADGTPHETNTRARLREANEKCLGMKPLFGIEQEYVITREGRPLGWPRDGFPAPQGPFYCGVGGDKVFGRELVEEHLRACMEIGIPISGINAEVMPGQWEFQVGAADPLRVSDGLWAARWLLNRLAEEYGWEITLEPKPVKGDWNGSGAHTNFSTVEMREEGGLDVINEACEKLSKRIDEHLGVYGHGYEERLTGEHETCKYDEFKWGIGDRGASVRIPLHVGQEGKGYLEDRRPCSNADPYEVTAIMLETVCLK